MKWRELLYDRRLIISLQIDDRLLFADPVYISALFAKV